ncbi:MAG: hypothetical protein V4592_09115 [Bacteroidota bacterium]
MMARVNTLPVYEPELQREMHRYRAAIYHQYHAVPMGALQNKALKALVLIKVQEELLQTKHLWPYHTYYDLLRDRKVVNRQRQLIAGQGGIVYGPVQYSEESFFDYELTNALIKLMRALGKNQGQYQQYINTRVKTSQVIIYRQRLAAVKI